VRAARELTAGTAQARGRFATIPVVRAGCAHVVGLFNYLDRQSLAILQIPISTISLSATRSSEH